MSQSIPRPAADAASLSKARDRLAAVSVFAGILALFLFLMAWAQGSAREAISQGESALEAFSDRLALAEADTQGCEELPAEARPDCHRRLWEASLARGAAGSEASVAWLSALAGPALALSEEPLIAKALEHGQASALREAEFLSQSASRIRASCRGVRSIACPAATARTAEAIDRLAEAHKARVPEAAKQARLALAAWSAKKSAAEASAPPADTLP